MTLVSLNVLLRKVCFMSKEKFVQQTIYIGLAEFAQLRNTFQDPMTKCPISIIEALLGSPFTWASAHACFSAATCSGVTSQLHELIALKTNVTLHEKFFNLKEFSKKCSRIPKWLKICRQSGFIYSFILFNKILGLSKRASYSNDLKNN